MWFQYFGFQEDPFGVSPDPRYLYPSRTHQEALKSLEDGFYSDRGFIAMIAPPGMGKTTLLYRFLEDTRETARSVFLFDIDAECEPRDFVGYVLRGFGIIPGKSSYEMHRQLSDVLVKETEAGRKCVVVIDEAQSLSDAVLERARLLTNFETTQGKLLQIILSGQPQLADKLTRASLVQLRQRVSTVCRIEQLSTEETVAYIDYRLKQAGYDGDPLFTEDALKLIAEASHGTPRTINNLCFNALSLCCALESKQVDSSMVAKAIANLELIPQSREPIFTAGAAAARQSGERKQWKQAQGILTRWGQTATSQVALWVPAIAAVLILSVLGVLRFGGTGSSQPHTMGDERPLNLDDRPLNLKIPTASAPAPAAANIGKASAAETTTKAKTLEARNTISHLVSAPPSAPVVQPPALPALESLPVVGLVPAPKGSESVVTQPQTSPAVQTASTSASASEASAQQSSGWDGQSGSSTGARKGAVVALVRPALAVNAPTTPTATPAANVRPALPTH